MRLGQVGVLFGLLLLSGCGPTTSPRLETIRPHLKAGTNRNELIEKIGITQSELEQSVGATIDDKKAQIVLLDLDGSKRQMKLRLAFRDQKLIGAAVVKPDRDGKYTEVDELIVAEKGG
jgi:hypothetical protein